jgi:hypothetical protein
MPPLGQRARSAETIVATFGAPAVVRLPWTGSGTSWVAASEIAQRKGLRDRVRIFAGCRVVASNLEVEPRSKLDQECASILTRPSALIEAVGQCIGQPEGSLRITLSARLHPSSVLIRRHGESRERHLDPKAASNVRAPNERWIGDHGLGSEIGDGVRQGRACVRRLRLDATFVDGTFARRTCGRASLGCRTCERSKRYDGQRSLAKHRRKLPQVRREGNRLRRQACERSAPRSGTTTSAPCRQSSAPRPTRSTPTT